MGLDRNVSPLQALEDEMVQAVVAETGLKESMARYMVAPIIRHLCSEYGGDRIYIPVRRDYPVDEIRAAFERTRDVRAVCNEFGVSRRTLYRLLNTAA